MNDMPCTKQVRSPALRSHGDLIWLMAEACLEFIPTCQQTFPVAQTVKCLPTMQETQVQSLGREDPLEKEMATHSSTLDWKIPWAEEPGRLQVHGVTKRLTRLHFLSFFTQHLESQFPDQESNLCPLQWKHRILTSRPPGNSSS